MQIGLMSLYQLFIDLHNKNTCLEQICINRIIKMCNSSYYKDSCLLHEAVFIDF